MFDAVRNNKRIVQVFLGVITIPFALWGVDSWIQNLRHSNEVAKVGSSKITQTEFMQAMQNAHAKPEMRDQVLEQLINQRVVALQIDKFRLQTSQEALREAIAKNDAFKVDGQFSLDMYRKRLAGAGYTQTQFEQGMAQDLATQQLINGVTRSVLVPNAIIDRLLALQDEVREVATVDLPLEKYTAQVKLAPDAAKKAYDADLKRWEVPEQAKLEYLVASPQELAAQIEVSEEQIGQFYKDPANAKRFLVPEERRARHILIEVPRGATPEVSKVAQAKAEALLKQVQAKPDSFAELAKANSQDPGSAPKGGDLGFFARDAMVKPFADTAFSLKPGQMSGLVRSEFGFHIIKLEEVRGGQAKTLEQARPDIVEELKRQGAAKKFTEIADGFINTVYEQSDSLKPAADKFKLSIKTTDWIAKGAKGLPPPFNDKVLAAAFAPDAVKNHRNTEAVDVGNSTLVAARVTAYKPAALQRFEEVRPQIELRLVADQALKLAKADGEAQLARLRKGEAASVAWTPPVKITRIKPAGLEFESLKAVFRQPVDKLPAYTGREIPGKGYLLVRISAVEHPKPSSDDKRREAFVSQYKSMLAEEDLRAYVLALRDRFKVKTYAATLDAATTKEKE